MMMSGRQHQRPPPPKTVPLPIMSMSMSSPMMARSVSSSQAREQAKAKKSKNTFLTIVLVCLTSSFLSFYVGIYIGWNMDTPNSSIIQLHNNNNDNVYSHSMNGNSNSSNGNCGEGCVCDCSSTTTTTTTKMNHRKATPLAADFRQSSSSTVNRDSNVNTNNWQPVSRNTNSDSKEQQQQRAQGRLAMVNDAITEQQQQRAQQQPPPQQQSVVVGGEQQPQPKMKENNNNDSSNSSNNNNNNTSNEEKKMNGIDWEVKSQRLQRYIDTLEKRDKRQRKEMEQLQQEKQLQAQGDNPHLHQSTTTHTTQQKRSERTRFFIPRVEYVNRTEFIRSSLGKELGVAYDTPNPDNDRVLILYGNPKAYPVPFEHTHKNREGKNEEDWNIPLQDATQNCDFLHVVMANPDRHKQCIAIVGQYESYHVHRFMRIPPPTVRTKTSIDPTTGIQTQVELPPHLQTLHGINSSVPLRFVARGMQQNGRISQKVPKEEIIDTHWKELVKYKSHVEQVLIQEVKPLLQQVAAAAASGSSSNNTNTNTVIVMVCNFGQSELLLNFICNARAKGFETILDTIMLFATDEETYDLATSLGLTAYYNTNIFGAMPKQAAKEYADDTFRLLMFAKVYCVHMVSQLGYHFLFQDVDVIWYKNPLQWFHNKTNTDQDMYFQDDGSRALYYAPYAANTGFYYVRNNERTRYFFHSLLMAGDLIMSSYSHQIALNALLSEHISLYGLSVKICDRNGIEFPGGYAYHERHDMMKEYLSFTSSSSNSSSLLSPQQRQQQIQTSERHPYIFHFCYTDNKDNKIRFMEQMGEWYLQKACKSVSKNDIIMNNNINNNKTTIDIITKHCCSATPLVKCHYRDKPSINPCLDSPALDENAKSFW